MLRPADHFHGSDLEKIEALYNVRKEDIVNFSANVNPLGISARLREYLAAHLDVVSSYPDREYTLLRRAIAKYCAASERKILVGNGSTELISMSIRMANPRRALILGPAYSEYEREVRLSGGSCLYFPLKAAEDFVLSEAELTAALKGGIDLLILCNPNNPTSSVIPAGQMRRIMETCSRLGIPVIVDETYIEFTEDPQAVSCIPLTDEYEHLIVLRGVSKFFAAPGLRLGYAVTGDPALISGALSRQDPWTVSSLADIAGQFLFTDTEYIRQTRELIGRERARIWQALSALEGVRPYPPHANFILARLTRGGLSADGLFEYLIRRGLMIRDCSSFPFLDRTWFRFCFMLPNDNDRLLEGIREFLENGD